MAMTLKSDTLASAASTSSGIIFGGRSFKQVNYYVPSMSTAANMRVQGTVDGTNYFNVFHPPINSSTVTVNPMVIPSGAVTGGAILQIPVAGLAGIRLVATDVVNNGLAMKVVAYD
jgi:hypothetical protein